MCAFRFAGDFRVRGMGNTSERRGRCAKINNVRWEGKPVDSRPIHQGYIIQRSHLHVKD